MPSERIQHALRLSNTRLDDAARIAMVSLPVPLDVEPPTRLGDLPTQTQPVGWWPESVAGQREVVRRQLMFATSEQELPGDLSVVWGDETSGTYSGPEMRCRIVSKKNTGVELTEVNEAEITFGDKTIGLRMGLRHAGELKWWEWVRLEELWSGPLCKAVRLGGFIEVEHFGDDYYKTIDRLTHAKNVHYHNWLRGEVLAILFANGVVHLTCRHVNNHLFDHGRDLQDVLPVIAFACPSAPEICESLDGSTTRHDLGDVLLNLDEAATACSPEHPGRLATEGGLVVYQPYDGIEIRGDSHHRVRDDGYICKVEDGVMPKGVARTLRFSLGMGDAAPVITRLVVPDWWYGLSRELWGDEVLPAHDSWDRVVEASEAFARQRAAEQVRCFDNGILTPEGWEGEIPYSQMLYFYLSGDLQYFDIALNDSYHLADIGFDHATETMRMHNYPFGAISPPLYRTVSMTYGYLETGDPYLLECSESAATRFYWIDRHNWPRRSYGRDAASVRSLIFLWDYAQEPHYLRMAREALGRLIACQRPDGSYGDQGGTVGGCGGMANEITKVWMAVLANDAVVDYLLRCPDDDELRASLIKTGEFVLRSQLEDDGTYYWAYEYKYGDNPGNGFQMATEPESFARHPTGRATSGYKARLLSFLSRHTGDPRYFEAWERFFETNWAIPGKEPGTVGYTSNKVVQCVPFAQAHRWDAQLVDGTVRVSPLLTNRTKSLEGVVSTPFGKLELRCEREQSGVRVSTKCESGFDVAVLLPGQDKPETMGSNDSKVFA